jgi:hypothetical protein
VKNPEKTKLKDEKFTKEKEENLPPCDNGTTI